MHETELNNIKTKNINVYDEIIRCYNFDVDLGKLNPVKDIFELIENRSKAIKEHYSDFSWLYGRLGDYRSKNVLFGVVENWLTFNWISLDRITEKTFCHYFDHDLIRCNAEEVFVDLGTEEVDVVKIDDDITEPVTFIKMDLEDGEQNAILGCKRHIQATHPKLAISVYHNLEDIWKRARMIDEISPGYRFFMRYYRWAFNPIEIVLLCVFGAL